jgi:PAS domain S-box-containing protein
LREDDHQLRVRASIGLDPDPTGFSMPLEEGIAGRVVASGRPLAERAVDLARDASPVLRRADIRVLYALPLLEEDKVIAVIEVGSSSADELSEPEQQLVNVMASRVDLAIHQHMLRETAELRAAELEAVIDSIPEAIAIGTHEGVRYNKAALEITGDGAPAAEPVAELPGNVRARDVETGVPLPPDETPLNKALRGETTTREVAISRPHTGETVVMRTSAAPIQTHGRLIGAVAVSADITEAKRATEAQRESLGHLQAVLDYAPAAVFIRDLEGRFVLINRVYGVLSAIDPQTAPGKTLRELRSRVPRSQIDTVEADDRKVIETRTPLQREEELVVHGERRTFLSFKFPLGDASGRLYAVCGISTEITDRKRVEEARERVIGILGHDLRNPVNAITLATKMLEGPELDADARRKIVHRIGRSSQRMSRMIAELLDFTRGHLGGGIPISPKPTDLGSICTDVTDEVLMAHPNARLELHQAGELTGVWDKERLAQVVSNLAGNALKHRVPGSLVRIDVVGAKDEVVLIVKNRAARRIPEAQLAGLFDAFRRVEQVRPSNGEPGLGLGLYIAREIVRAHGGSIDAISSKDCSFSVVVRLPRRASARA